MLLLVTILLVVIGTISLVIGFVQSSLLLIYISIACSVIAAAVLLIFSRMSAKSKRVETAEGGPSPLDDGAPDRGRSEPVPAYAGTGLIGGASSTEAFAPEGGRGAPSAGEMPDDVVDDDFPIERYESRRVGEILPLLAELDLDELDLVREREEQGKSRATVLARIDQLIDQLEAEDRDEAASRFDDEVDTPPLPVAAAGHVDDDDDEMAHVSDPPVEAAVPARTTQSVSVAALPEDDGYFPIEDYDDLRASEILPLLPELDDDELGMVRQREEAAAGRPSILRRIDALLAPDRGAVGAAGVEDVPEAAPEPAPSVVTSAVPSSGASRKGAAKRAPAVKRAPAAKKAPAAVVSVPPVTKAAPKRAAAKRVAPVAPVPTSSAKRPPAAAKAATAKKASATKVVPAKVVAAKAGRAPSAVKAAKATKVTRKTSKG